MVNTTVLRDDACCCDNFPAWIKFYNLCRKGCTPNTTGIENVAQSCPSNALALGLLNPPAPQTPKVNQRERKVQSHDSPKLVHTSKRNHHGIGKNKKSKTPYFQTHVAGNHCSANYCSQAAQIFQCSMFYCHLFCCDLLPFKNP